MHYDDVQTESDQRSQNDIVGSVSSPVLLLVPGPRGEEIRQSGFVYIRLSRVAYREGVEGDASYLRHQEVRVALYVGELPHDPDVHSDGREPQRDLVEKILLESLFRHVGLSLPEHAPEPAERIDRRGVVRGDLGFRHEYEEEHDAEHHVEGVVRDGEVSHQTVLAGFSRKKTSLERRVLKHGAIGSSQKKHQRRGNLYERAYHDP